MSLTGPVFLVGVVILTVAAFVMVVVFWPSMAGRSLGRVLGRVGMLLTVNLLVLLTAATQLNADNMFFSSWTDLKGAFGAAPATTVSTHQGAAAQAARVAVPAPPLQVPKLPPPLPAGGSSTAPGTLSYTVKGAASGVVAKITVVLPPGYTLPANASTRYPVIQAFPGYPGGVESWNKKLDFKTALAQKVATGQMRMPLVVMAQYDIPAGVDTECVNGSPGNPQVETWLATDVPNWVVENFRVETGRGSWATIGLSAGGWCAAMITMLHPEQYSAAIAMGAFFRPLFGEYYQPYPSDSALAKRYDLVALAQRTAPPVAIWLQTSHSDKLSYPSSAAFLKAVRPPMGVDATVLQDAGHRTSVWKEMLPSTLTWLGTNIPGFIPVTPGSVDPK